MRSKQKQLRLLMLLPLLLLFSLGAQQQEPKPPSAPAELEKTRNEIRDLKASLEKVRKAARGAQQQLEVINLQVEITTRELALALEAQHELEDERAVTEARINELSEQIESGKQRIASRVRQLDRLGGLSYLRLLVSIDTTSNPFEAIGMLSYLVHRDANEIDSFRGARAEMHEKKRELAKQEARLALSIAETQRRERAVIGARQEQQRVVTALHTESSESEQRLAELEEKERRLERLLDLLYQRNKPSEIAGGKSIGGHRGSLEWPLKGKVLEEFGRHRSEKFATFTAINGIRIEAPPNGEVHSVYAGTVLYSQWFKGYGNLIIVDHGDRIFSLYGNTKIGMVQVGSKVKAGDVIATVSEAEGDEPPYLYFELREDNKPVNPRNWLKP